MAGDDSAIPQPKVENPDPENATEQGSQGVRAGQQASMQQQSEVNDARPALPPRPLPASHQETSKGIQSPGPVQFQPALPTPHPQPFVQQQYGPYQAHYGDMDEVPYKVPFNPRWHKLKIVLMLLAVSFSAVIIGVSVATGYTPLGDPGRYYIHDSAYITGVSAAAAVLSLLFVALEMLNICLSKDRRGMHPGWLVTYNLVIGILAAAAFGIMIHYTTAVDGYDGWYRFFQDKRKANKELILFKVLLGFDFTLFLVHFILFIGACFESNQRNQARRAVQIVQVPFDPSRPLPAGYQTTAVQYAPTPQQALAMQNAGWAPPPRQRPQRVSVHGVIPYITPEQAALYGGYYAPMPTPAPPQQARGGHSGYYAPAPYNPFTQAAAPGRSSMRGARAPVAAVTGSAKANNQPTSAAATKPEAPLPPIPAADTEPQPDQESQKKDEVIVSERAVPEEAVSEKVVSAKVVPEETMSEKVMSEKVVSEEGMSEEGMSERVVSEKVVSEK